MLKKNFILLLLIVSSLITNAQLTVDPAFNSTDHGGGKHNGVFGGENEVDNALLLPNGKILTGGFYGVMHNKNNQGVSLLNTDGSIDSSFNAPGINDDLNDGITAMALQQDGKILLGGYMSVYLGQNVYHLVRINPDGILDTSFHTGTGFNNSYQEVPRSIVIQNDGKIIIGGNFINYNGVAVSGLIRLNEDGSLDNSFNFLSDSVTTVNKVIIKADGKFLIGGSFKMHSNNLYKNLAVLNTDGSLDESFNAGNAITVNVVSAFDIQTDKKIVFTCDSSLYRVDSNGNSDVNFIRGNVSNNYSTGYYSRIADIKIQLDGKILIAGTITAYNSFPEKSILRLNANGSIDNSFSTGSGFGGSHYGGSVDNRIKSINLFPDGRIFITGGFLFYRGIWQGTMAELNNDGSVNATFNADNGNGADANVNKITVQTDNKILIAGYFNSYNGVTRNKIARLNTDGTLDNSFNPGTGPDSCNYLNTVVLQTDGKILAGGNFAHFNNALKSFIVRLNSDGSLDNSFNFNALTRSYGDVDDGIKVIALQQDGKIIVGFDKIRNYVTNINSYVLLLRLNTDGSVDNSFNASSLNSIYTGNAVYSIQIQNDGKIIVAGDLNANINGIPKGNLIRLNSNGSFDSTFNSNGNGTNSRIYSVNIQTDGKIVFTGRPSSYNNISFNTLARLNNDGSLDQLYSPAIPDTSTDFYYSTLPYSILDSNNNVILSYLFSADEPYGRILRYNVDGTMDNTFGLKNKTDYLVSDMAVQNDKLLLGGFIESFNGLAHNRITRLFIPQILSVTWINVNATLKNLYDVEVTWQTASELNVKSYTVQKSTNALNFSNLITMLPAKVVGNNKYIYTDIDGMSLTGKVYYRIMETDYDGKNQYSKTVLVNDENPVAIGLYPNPVQQVLHIKNLSNASNKLLIVLNADGKVVNSLKTSATNCTINTSKLASGVYYLKIVSGSESQLIKFVKN